MARVFLNPAYEQQMYAEVEQQRATFRQLVEQARQPGFAQTFAGHARMYPYARPGVLLGLTEAGLPAGDEVANEIARMSLEERLADDPTFGLPEGASAPPEARRQRREAQRGSGFFGALGDFGKGLVRGAFMGLSAPVQEVANVVTSVGEAALDGEPGFFGDAWNNFTQQAPRAELLMAIGEAYSRVQAGEMDLSDPEVIRDLIQGDEEFIGTGFLPGGEIAQRRTDQKYNLQLNGQFLTPGRTALELIDRGDWIEEGSSAYGWISGLADAALQVFGDPMNLVAGTGFAPELARVAGALDDLPEVVRAADAVDAAGFADQLRTLTLRSPRRMVDREGAEAFLSGGNREVNLLVAGLTQETNAQRIRNLFGGKMGERMAVRLADASRPEQVVDELKRSLDDAHIAGLPHLTRRQSRTVRQGLMAPEAARPVLRRTTDRYTFAGTVPEGHAVLSAYNPAKAADDLVAWYRAGQSTLTTAAAGNIDRAEDLADRVLRIQPGPTAQSELGTIVREAMDDFADQLIGDKPDLRAQLTLSPDYLSSQRAYLWDASLQEITDRPGARFRTEVDGQVVERTLQEGETLSAMVDGAYTAVPNAALVTQIATTGYNLPDWREVRRATSAVAHLGPLADLGYNVLDAARSFAQPLWMAATLLRPAVTGRILLDSQTRMAMDGVPSAFRHPVEFIAYLIGRKGDAPITGDLWDDYDSYTSSMEALSGLKDAGGGARIGRQFSNDFVRFNRLGNYDDWLDSSTRRLALLAQDPVMRHLAGHTPEDTATWLLDGAGRKWLDTLNNFALNGTVRSQQGVDDLLRAYGTHMDFVTGGNGYLKADLAQGRVAGVQVTPGFNPGTQEPVTGTLRQVPTARYVDEARAALAGNDDLIRSLPDDVYGSRPLRGTAGDQVATRFGQFRDWMFDQLMTKPENLLARSVTYRARYFDTIEALVPRMNRAEAEDVIRRMREHSNVGGLLDKGGRAQLDRMEKAARNLPTGEVDEARIAAFSRLAGSEAGRESLDLLYDLSERAVWEDAAALAAPFVAVWKDTLATYFHPTRGLVTTNPVMARRALQTLRGAREGDPDGDGRGFIYENEQGEEIFTIPDWSMALAMGAIGGGAGAAAGRLAGQTAAAVGQGVLSAGAQTITRRAGAAAGAAVGAVAGNRLLDTATDMGGGANVNFIGRASGLNVVSATILPGAGPVVQIPLSYIVEQTPEADWLWQKLYPFGRPDVEGGALESLAPAWSRRFLTAIRHDPESVRLFGNTVADVQTALLASGRYGDEDGFLDQDASNRLLKDATERARAIYFVRGFAQTSLPTGPQVEFTANTDAGEVGFYALATEFRQLQDEYGRDAATGEFIRRYGTNLLGVTIPKSRTVRARSFDPDGADWERQNPDLVRDYANTVAFFAPGADTGEFDFQAYNRAISRGDSVDLSPADRSRLLNNFIGSAFIRSQKNLMGREADTINGRIYLADTRATLREAYPGYGATDNLPSAINTDAAISELATAVTDDRLRDRPLTRAIAEMLRLRAEAIEVGRSYGATQFQTATAQEYVELRDAYRVEAARLMQETPEFAEVWRLVFDRELNDDIGNREVYEQPQPYDRWQGPSPLLALSTR